MSYVKHEIENASPKIFGPQALPPGSDQGAVDYEQFLIAVEAEENKIIDAEGIWHVNTIYYALAEDASIHRTFEAERRVNERARSMDRYLTRGRRAS